MVGRGMWYYDMQQVDSGLGWGLNDSSTSLTSTALHLQ